MSLLIVLLFFARTESGELSSEYLAAIRRADSLYWAGRYQAALIAYETAQNILPDEPGPQVGIGWTLLRMSEYARAEEVLRRVLELHPDNEQARRGLALLPLFYRVRLTATLTGSSDAARILAGFLEYNHLFRTTFTVGVQNISLRGGWNGMNAALVVFHRLRYPWSVRLDVFLLASTSDRAYRRYVYAPSLGYRWREWNTRAVCFGWDRLGTVGLQLDIQHPLPFGLDFHATPTLNRSGDSLGWFIPASVSRQLTPYLRTQAMAGWGSIADYIDLDVPALYNQWERFTATARLGADATIVRRFRLAAFVTWEKYSTSHSIFLSFVLSARF